MIVEDITTHQSYIESQGIPIIRDFSIPNLKDIEVKPWERMGVSGAFVVLEGTEEVNDAYVLEIPPGGNTLLEHHMFEEIAYVLSGRGAAVIWNREAAKRTFEWQEGSLFAIPLNAWHQFFNIHGSEEARLFIVSSAPMAMNFYRSIDFAFNDSYIFTERFDGRENFFRTEGEALPGRTWKTNFVPDVRSFPLVEWASRGAGGISRRFDFAGANSWAHISQFPVATYKKAHRHGPGANVVIITGEGYSLLWPAGKERERVKVDWKPGSLLVPPNMFFHQHFNVGATPARYLAIHKPKLAAYQPRTYVSVIDRDIKKGGGQIEYADEDPAIRALFMSELAKRGVEMRMPAPK